MPGKSSRPFTVSSINLLPDRTPTKPTIKLLVPTDQPFAVGALLQRVLAPLARPLHVVRAHFARTASLRQRDRVTKGSHTQGYCCTV